MKMGWPSAVVALGFLALVGLFFWRVTDGSEFDTAAWAAVGTIVGVVVGAIPTFFFKGQADKAQEEATSASRRAEEWASIADPAQATALKANNPAIFG